MTIKIEKTKEKKEKDSINNMVNSIKDAVDITIRSVLSLYFSCRCCCIYQLTLSNLWIQFSLLCLTHGILQRPAPSSGLISHTIVLAQMSDLRHQRIIGVWIREQGAYGQQHLHAAFIKEEEEEK